MNPAIITGYDKGYEKFAAYWLHCIRKFSSWPVYVCNFGFSEEHKKWLEDSGVSVYSADSSQQGWFLKPFAIRDCPARFGVHIDIDAEAMQDLSGFENWIRPGRIGAAPDPNDVHYYKVGQPLNSGIIPFDRESKAVSEWCNAVKWKTLIDGEKRVVHDRKGDQGYLNLKVDRGLIDVIPRAFNWFEQINDFHVQPSPEAVIWHHLGPVGKRRFLHRSDLWKSA